MRKAQIIVALIGILLPYAARLPRGIAWLAQYTDGGPGGFLLLSGFNVIAWGAIVALFRLYKRPESVVAPALFGFGFLAWAHNSLDLAADAQAAVALVFIPIYALLPIAVGGVIGYGVDRHLTRRDAA
jgi:hypothetical protein